MHVNSYPVAGADERVGSADSENETDSDDALIFYESDSEIDSSGTSNMARFSPHCHESGTMLPSREIF